MGVYFQSVCSSSSGNCLGLWSETTRLLIDCGLGSMKRTRQALSLLYGGAGRIDSVLLTHMHSDHISYYPLRVLEEYGATVRLHEDCAGQLREKHFNGYGFGRLQLQPYQNKAFTVGDFRIQPFRVAHHPGYPTFGYRISSHGKEMVFVTDFRDWENVFEHFVDADFIFVESNHDPDLLRQYYNPNSRYHLANPKTAALLIRAGRESRNCPQMVMLGHLSSQRNEPGIALGETMAAFRQAGMRMGFHLKAAPLRTAGEAVRIA